MCFSNTIAVEDLTAAKETISERIKEQGSAYVGKLIALEVLVKESGVLVSDRNRTDPDAPDFFFTQGLLHGLAIGGELDSVDGLKPVKSPFDDLLDILFKVGANHTTADGDADQEEEKAEIAF